MSMPLLILGVGLLTYLFRKILRHLQVIKELQGVPTTYCGVETFEGFFRSVFPHIPWLFPAGSFTMKQPFKKFENVQSDLIAVTQFDSDYASYIVGSGATASAVFGNPTKFDKAQSFRLKVVNTFGHNIITAANGFEHRKHRDVVRGCFSESIMRTVWDKAYDGFDIMMEGCGLTEGGTMVNVQACMTRYTLNVLGGAGFGQDWPWETPQSKDGEYTLVEALTRFEHSSAAQLLIPLKVMLYSPFKTMREWGRAQVTLLQHMDNMIADRRAKPSEGRSDILSALVAGQDASEQGQKLRENEVFANLYIFILAGHETSANTLAFLICFMALNPDVQEKMLEEIEGNEASHSALHLFKYCLNCIYETLRLRDIVLFNSKVALEDVQITYNTWTNGPDGRPDPSSITPRSHLIKAGSRVAIDSAGCSMNSLSYSNPYAFKPERWDDPQLKQHFTGFALGTRQCIGKRFGEVEMLAFVCRLVKTFKVHPVKLPGETEEGMKGRMLRSYETLTLGSGNWDIRLDRR